MDTPDELTPTPGKERWAVKIGTDAEASSISTTAPTDTTIAILRGLVPPPDPDEFEDRDDPVEATCFTLSVMLTGYKEEQDGDYHLVLDDGAGHTMIAEIPDPDFCADSAWLTEIIAARQAFNAKFGVQLKALRIAEEAMMAAMPSGKSEKLMITKVNVPVTVTGIGFFDRLHGQTGVAPNGIELHPVLSIEFA